MSSSHNLGGATRCGRIIGPSLDKIIKNAAWRKHTFLVSASKSVLDKLESLSDSPDPSSPLFGLSTSDSDAVLQPLLLSLDTAYAKVIEPALDCSFKLFSLSLLRGEVCSPDSTIYKLLHAICKVCGIGEESIELAVLRVLLAAVRSPCILIRGDSLLHLVRTCYNVYLGGFNGTNQICAKSVLAQIMLIVFTRSEANSMDVSLKTVNVNDLLAITDKNVNEGSSVHICQGFINDVITAGEAAPPPDFRLVLEGDSPEPAEEGEDAVSGGTSKIREDGFHLFKNLCKLSMKFSSQDNTDDQILVRGKTLSLELLKVIIDNGGPIWRSDERFLNAIKQYLCLSLLKNSALSVMSIFQLQCAIFTTLLQKYRSGMKSEVGIFFPMLVLRVLENVLQPSFLQKMTVLSLLENICHDPYLIIDIFVNFDCDVESPNIFERIVNGLLKTALGPPPGSSTTLTPAQDITFRHESVKCLVSIIKAMGTWMDQQLSVGESLLPKTVEKEAPADNHSNSNEEDGTTTDHDFHPDLSSESSDAATLEQRRAYKIELQKGVTLFNRKPSKGIDFLISCKKVGSSPTEVVSFLRKTTGLNATMIGDYLGEREEFPMKVMHAYVDSFDFKEMNFGEAIRFFLRGFRLPGEAQKIDRIMEKFAERFCKCNPNSFSSADTAYVLAYSVIMLNTDAHNSMVKEKMTKADFIRNNRGIDDGKDLPEEYLAALYDQVVKNEIKMSSDSSAPESKQSNGLNKLLGLDGILSLVYWTQTEEKAVGANGLLIKHIQEKFRSEITGAEITDPEHIKQIAAAHFSQFLQHQPDTVAPPPVTFLASLLDYRCPEPDAAALVAPITSEEITRTLFRMPNNKAPGPDGYPVEFYRAVWPTIGPDFIVAIQSYFLFGLLPRGINSTLLALIPKGDSQTTMRDYRPISCLNITYKVISKIMANRLKRLLPNMIEDNQSAFIRGRLLLENALLATELVKDYHNKNSSPRSTLKLDVAKAFDTINWSFIINVLTAMGLPDQFTNWIYTCISTAMFSVVVNGELAGYFPSSRGIRQGCSLSPYLYVIANNVLSKLLNNAALQGRFGYHHSCGALNITHLSFADDILVFTDGATASLDGILQVTDHFSRLSGLQINKDKSSIFVGGRNTAISNAAIAQGFKAQSLPIKYLGLPLTTKTMRPIDYEPLIDSIRKRFTAWSAKTLSYAGRLQLIKSVIHSITNFWLSVFQLPIGCLQKIDCLCSNFLWSGTPSDHTKAKVKWADLCYPYNEGGLGIRSLRDSSRIFAMALIWRLASTQRSLWVSWTQRYLLREHTFWEAQIRTSGALSGSWIWRRLLTLRETAKTFFRYKLGSGRTAHFWTDVWIGNTTILSRVGATAIIALGLHAQATVAEAAPNGSWTFRRTRDHALTTLIQEITNFQPPTEDLPPDQPLWRSAPDSYKDSFNSRNTWSQLRLRRPIDPRLNLIWFKQSTPRYAFIVWLAFKNRLSTGTRMQAWGLTQQCLFCNAPEESRDHLFFDCTYSAQVWRGVCGQLIQTTHSTNWYTTMDIINSATTSFEDRVLLQICFQSSIYYIWRERNDRRHSTTPKPSAALINMLRSTVATRLMSLPYAPPHRLSGLCQRWGSTR